MKPTQHELSAALQALLAQAKPVQGVEEVPLEQALGRVLAKDMVSLIHAPPADNSQMDGYAVSSQDCAVTGATLTVTQRIAAGKPSDVVLQTGQAARIFTGAFIPAGADAVVMQEACVLDGQTLTVNEAVKAGQWVRVKGCDVAQNSVVLRQGTRLTAISLGLLASIGVAKVPVYYTLTVGLMCTGDELTPPGQPLPLGHIYNSNRPMLRALLQSMGCKVVDTGDIADTLPATQNALSDLAKQCDIVVSTGGVSVGEEDHVKAAVLQLGRLDLWSLAIKPGKPFACGVISSVRPVEKGEQSCDIPFLGLPGNPVSALITFWLMVRPFILVSSGANAQGLPASIPVKAAFDCKVDRRREFLRVKLNYSGEAELFGNQNSGVLTSVAWGDGLVDIPMGTTVQKGDWVQYIPFSALF